MITGMQLIEVNKKPGSASSRRLSGLTYLWSSRTVEADPDYWSGRHPHRHGYIARHPCP